MRPDERELDEEIRGHMAISIKERIERGEDPEAARLASLREFGYVPAILDSMRGVWYGRWFDAVIALGQDMPMVSTAASSRASTSRTGRASGRAGATAMVSSSCLPIRIS